MRAVAPVLERVPWDEFEPEFLDSWGWPDNKWMPEHLAVTGPTGSGKSYFATHVLTSRAMKSGSHCVILATKPADATILKLKSKGWKIIRKWPPNYGDTRVVFWPEGGKIGEGNHRQAEAVKNFMQQLWKPDANTIVMFDEIAYVEEPIHNDGGLGLKGMVTKYWREARSLGITIVAQTQRPRIVSRYMFSEASWAVAFRPDDMEDAKRVAEILGNRGYLEALMNLNEREFIIIRKRSREAYISKLGR